MKRKSFKEILASSGPDRPKSPPKSRAQRLAEVSPPTRAELLECRRMFDSATIVGGVLVVTGDSGAELIEVYEIGTDVYVDFDGSTLDTFVPGNIYAGYVSISALGGGDTVTIWGWPTSYELRFPVLVYGGDGADVITGSTSAYPDSLYGDAANDTIDGTWGNDLIYGNEGNDSLQGGPDDDFLYGGTGNDYLDGGAGNDEVRGEAESDTLWGNSGTDRLFGGDGNDFLHAEGGGVATVDGGAGSDAATITGGVDTYTFVETVTIQ